MRLHTPDADLTEKQWQSLIVDLARQVGWKRAYHTHDSRRSTPGFPDLVLLRPGDRVIYVEVKTERGKLSAAQQQWLDDLRSAGQEAYVWRPSDQPHVVATLTRRRHAHAVLAHPDDDVCDVCSGRSRVVAHHPNCQAA